MRNSSSAQFVNVVSWQRSFREMIEAATLDAKTPRDESGQD